MNTSVIEAMERQKTTNLYDASKSIFIVDGPFWTSAGGSAGIDLALGMVEEDLGAEIARLVGKMLVVYHRRAGGQSQHSTRLHHGVCFAEQMRQLVHVDVDDRGREQRQDLRHHQAADHRVAQRLT